MFSMLLSFLFSTASITVEELPVERVQAIAESVTQEMAASMPVAPRLIVTHRPEPTPLGAIRYSNRNCRIIINTNPKAWAQWGRFLSASNEAHWDEIVRASVAHEMGHCMPEHTHQLDNIELTENTLSALARSGHSHGGQVPHILKQELFADTVAVLYAREMMPSQQAEAVLEAMLSAREKFGSRDPSHDTSRELRTLIEQGASRQSQETYGQAAARLLAVM